MTLSTSRARPLVTPALAMAAWLVLGAPPLRGAPTLAARSSTAQIRKEQDAKLYFSIAAQEGMRDIDVSLTPPSGFTVTLETKQVPRELETGSPFTVVYTVTPPGRAVFFQPYSRRSDSREEKTFVFNVGYSVPGSDGGQRRLHQSTELTVDYSIAPRLYLALGVLGVILGGLIKLMTSSTAQGALAGERGQASPPAPIRRIFPQQAREWVGLLGNVTVGFIVLLVLARERIPTKGWYDSLALGIAVAILSDDQLLSKVRAVLPLR